MVNVMDKLSEEGLKENYKSTVKKEITVEGSKITGGFETTDPIDTFKEFGTGLIGSQSPHTSDALAKAGWKYDINQHGEKGWKYPKKDGSFGWTKGQRAKKKFSDAVYRVEEKAEEIIETELNESMRGE